MHISNYMPHYHRDGLIAFALLCALGLSSAYSFLLFHTLVEVISVVIACAIFMFAWHTRTMAGNNYLLVIGTAYLFVGFLDLLHALSYKGMGVFALASANIPTQLWICARYLESVSLLGLPFIMVRSIRPGLVFSVYGVASALAVLTIFQWPVFPDCFIAGSGLTPFKIGSEYVIMGLLAGAIYVLYRQKHAFHTTVFYLLIASILFTIFAELALTFYVSVYGLSNQVGHMLKLVSFFLLYKAIIETGLVRPYDLLFRELKSSTVKLCKNEKRFKEMAAMLPSGICETNADFKVTYMNEAALKMLGYTQTDIMQGLNAVDLIHTAYHHKAQKRFSQAFDGESIGSTEYRLLNKDGSEIEAVVNSAPAWVDNNVALIRTSITDVTELNKLRMRITETQKMETIGSIAGGLAHEFNNGLMGICGHIELLKLRSHSDKDDEHFVPIVTVCQRLALLTQQLLAYSRGGKYRTQTIEIKQFIHESLPLIKPSINPLIRIEIDDQSTQARIQADPRQLQMVLSAILMNASEAISQSGIIRIGISRQNSQASLRADSKGLAPGVYACLAITDTGSGMPEETLARIFEPFFSTKFHGRGLGMAAVYGIVKNHGGWIDVTAKPNKGATVKIYLPLTGEPTAANHNGFDDIQIAN